MTDRVRLRGLYHNTSCMIKIGLQGILDSVVRRLWLVVKAIQIGSAGSGKCLGDPRIHIVESPNGDTRTSGVVETDLNHLGIVFSPGVNTILDVTHCTSSQVELVNPMLLTGTRMSSSVMATSNPRSVNCFMLAAMSFGRSPPTK